MIFACSSQEQLVRYEKIEMLNMDSIKFLKTDYDIIPVKYKVVGCIPYFPEAKIEVKSFEILDSNDNIIPAIIIGGERAIVEKINYPEIAKRADIEGIVYLEFEIDENGFANNITITKDIGGLCGEETINAITKTKFIPAKLNNIPIDTRYRVAIQFRISPITKEN